MRKNAVALVVATVIVLGGGWAFIAKGEEGAHEVVPEIGGRWVWCSVDGPGRIFSMNSPTALQSRGIPSSIVAVCLGDVGRELSTVKWVPLLLNDQDIRLCEQPGR